MGILSGKAVDCEVTTNRPGRFRHAVTLSGMRRLLVLLLPAVLAACATVPPPEKRYTTAELQALQSAQLAWPATSADGERAQREADLAQVRATLALPPGRELDAALPQAMELVARYNQEVDTARPVLLASLAGLGARDVEAQRALLTAAYTLYPQEAAPAIWPLLPQLTASKPFAIAAYTLLAAQPASAAALRDWVPRQFPQWADDPRLTALMQRLTTTAPVRPPLADLLAAPLRPGYPVIFSLQRPGRQVQGLALVRAADGRFVREPDGRLFAVPQLALARTNLPGTITNGNTPQGVLTVIGAGTATHPTIGPTPYLHSKLPIEATVAEFEHADTTSPWSEAVYESFLPESWRAYPPLKEAWLAGRAGRDEILAHGTVLNPDYYRGAPYFPGTPSAGCLVADETWDPATGRQRSSNQLRLAQVFSRAGGRDEVWGYLVVVEVDPGAGPVSLDEAATWVTQAGR